MNEKKNTLALLFSSTTTTTTKVSCCLDNFLSFFSLSLLFSLSFLVIPPRLGLFNRLLKTPQRPHFSQKHKIIHAKKSSWWKHTWSAPRSSYGSAWRRTTRTSARPWTERACPRRKATWPRSTDLAAQVKLNSTTSRRENFFLANRLFFFNSSLFYYCEDDDERRRRKRRKREREREREREGEESRNTFLLESSKLMRKKRRERGWRCQWCCECAPPSFLGREREWETKRDRFRPFKVSEKP